MPFESQRAGCCSQGDIRAEGYAFIGLALRGKELAKGLSHATARLGFAPHGGLGHLVDTFPLRRREELCSAPMGTQGMRPA
jgi:hypothetical protein